MPRSAPHHIHLMSHDAMHAGAFYETMFGAGLVASKGANGLPRANLKLGDQDPDFDGAAARLRLVDQVGMSR